MDARQIWRAAQGDLQLQMTRASYDTWVKDSRGLSYEDGALIVAVSSPYARQWLQHRLLGAIKRT
ncbi:MAG: DnaA N-terminal domain-containing protein, partial [Anaerolineae bacterium]